MILRIIPQIVISGNQAWHTIGHKKNIYLGDPVNIVKIFNEFKADEIVIVQKNRFKFFTKKDDVQEKIILNTNCPITVGGGIRNFNDGKLLFDKGVDKILIRKMVYNNKKDVQKLINVYGSQSVSFCLNYKNINQKVDVESLKNIIKYCIEIGIGEVLVQDVSRSGLRKGLDFETYKVLKEKISIPIVLSGGYNGDMDLQKARLHHVDGIAASTQFCLNSKNLTPLINYQSLRLNTKE